MEALVCIRSATLADTGIINRIIERSIRIGCAFDHRNDPLLVSDWVSQSSVDFISGRLADPAFIFVSLCLKKNRSVSAWPRPVAKFHCVTCSRNPSVEASAER